MIEMGDRVVCIKTIISDGDTACVAGREYTVLGIMESLCGHEVSLDIGTSMDSIKWFLSCDECGWRYPGDGIWWLDISLFRKLDAESESFEEVLELAGDVELTIYPPLKEGYYRGLPIFTDLVDAYEGVPMSDIIRLITKKSDERET